MLSPGDLLSKWIETLLTGSMGDVTIVLEEGGEVVSACVEEAGDSHHAMAEGNSAPEGLAGVKVVNDGFRPVSRDDVGVCWNNHCFLYIWR